MCIEGHEKFLAISAKEMVTPASWKIFTEQVLLLWAINQDGEQKMRIISGMRRACSKK